MNSKKYVILVDLRENNGYVLAITEDDNDEGNIAQFEFLEDAIECAKQQPLCQSYPYVILDMDEQEVVDCG